jgi:predicted ester cyclase
MSEAQTAPSETADVVRTAFRAIFAGDEAPFAEHPGLNSLRTAFPPMLRAFPDFSAELVQQVSEGDRVASHWIFRGTHLGELYGIQPTGTQVQFQNLSICRVEDGKIVQYNSEIGWMAMLRQLRAWPPKGA